MPHGTGRSGGSSRTVFILQAFRRALVSARFVAVMLLLFPPEKTCARRRADPGRWWNSPRQRAASSFVKANGPSLAEERAPDRVTACWHRCRLMTATQPTDVEPFIAQTGDLLAVSVGTAHGMYAHGVVPAIDFSVWRNFPLLERAWRTWR